MDPRLRGDNLAAREYPHGSGDLLKLWQKLWLLFTVIWVVVAALNIVTILAFGEEVEPQKALWPLFFAVAVPAAAYGVAWLWDRFIR